MPRKQTADEPLVIVVVTEVEERVAVVAVDADVPVRQDLQADAGMPTELGRTDAQVSGAVERLDRAAIPAWPAQQEGRNAAAAHTQEQRRLNRGLCDLFVEELGRI